MNDTIVIRKRIASGEISERRLKRVREAQRRGPRNGTEKCSRQRIEPSLPCPHDWKKISICRYTTWAMINSLRGAIRVAL